ncbi:MAG: tetratricopeptide repeat protein [Acidobacteriota bacterium]|nr:tetratricopeptide repeat protein [Acidobacteriota bacterium]
MRLTPATAAVAALLIARPVAAQPPALPATPSRAEAYYEFMLARRLESDGNTAAALAALARAEALDPAASDIPAEMAALHARQNAGAEASAAAERALALDKDNVEAHRILALVLSAWAEGSGDPPAGETPASLRDKAVEHLRAIRGSPAMATDLGLQVTYGRQLLRAGQTDEAVTVLQAVVSQAPYVAEPFVLLAEARTSQGKMAEAAEALVQAAEINPRYYVSLGELYERLGRWAAAAGAYGQALEGVRSPSRDLRLRYIAALLNVPGGEGAGRARESLNELLATSPTDTRLLYLLSTAARQLRDPAGAESAARRILEADPTSLAGLSALARAMADQYHYRQVVDLLTPIAKDVSSRSQGRNAEAAAALAQLGIAHQQLGEYDAAIGVFASARALTPSDTTYALYLVQALLAARRYDRAEAMARDALVQDPSDLRLVRLRSQALSRMGRHAEAMTLLEGAITSESRSPELALALADAYAADKRFDEAVKVIEQAETAFGEDEEFTLRLIGLYDQAGRLADAERELRVRIDGDPLDAVALNYLGYMLADRTDRLTEAVALIERALRVEPDNPSYLDSLGWALFKQGKFASAAEPLGRAAAALPANSVIQDHLGDVLARQGKWSEAAAAWQRALDGDGESIDRAVVTKKMQDARRRR